MGEPSPGVRRLCVVATAGPAFVLTSACQATDVGRLCVAVDQNGGTETAFAPPGIDEVAVVTRIITVLRHLAVTEPGAQRPTLLAFHVGITRIEGEEFGGEAPLRTRALLRDPAIRAVAAASGRPLR